MLLARTAESIYWIGRYTERAECTARLVKTHANQVFDLPVSTGAATWEPLLWITGTNGRYEATRATHVTEQQVIDFLVTDVSNPSSIVSTLARARENMRSTRHRMPREAWEALNALYLFAVDESGATGERSGRFRYLEHLVVETQKLTGILHGTMSRDPAHAFFTLGQHLERADMTSRVIDVHADLLAFDGTDEGGFADVRWMWALKSVAAFQMYRRASGAPVAGSTLDFLLCDHRFPRSVAFCLDEVAHRLDTLERGSDALDQCRAALRFVHDANVEHLEAGALHEWIDRLQIHFDAVHGAVLATWFRPTTERAPSAAA